MKPTVKYPTFRENPSRAIYIVGEISQAMIDRLTPQILQLRAESSEPITVYIDSPGGNTYHARPLVNLLNSPNQDGKRCRVITVVTGTAASAAADILAAGYYAIAYQHAVIHYHGVRTSYSDITHESASTLAESLKQSNEGFALELAERVRKRFFFIYAQLRSEVEKIRAANPNASDVELLATCMGEKLLGGAKLLDLALKKHRRLKSLLAHYTQQLEAHGDNFVRPADKEAFLLNLLVQWELQENPEPAWRFGSQGLNAIREDFVLLADYEDGQHMRDLEHHIKEWGMFLLEQPEREEYFKLTGDAAVKYLSEHTMDKFRAVWHFLVSVCRALQQGENRLNAYEAYWLGLIDEVPGSSLATVREMMEQFAEEQEKEQSDKKNAKSGKVRNIAASTTKPKAAPKKIARKRK